MAQRLVDGSIRMADGRIVYADSVIQAQDLFELMPLIAPAPAWPFVSGGGFSGGSGTPGARGADGAPGAQGSQGASGAGAESLDQARAIGDTFTGGDVFWDNDLHAIFGKASGEANQDYGQVYFDHTNHLFVFDSTKDGAGIIRPMSFQMGGVQKASLAIDGGMIFGGATGGSQGAGTVNVSGNYYINGVAIAVAANAWVQGGNAFGANGVLGTNDAFPMTFVAGGNELARFNVDRSVYFGTTTPIPGLETGYDNKWLFIGTTPAGVVGNNLAMILQNISTETSAVATILACNDSGVGASLSAFGSAWVDLGQGFTAGDAGLAMNTCLDIDPVGDAGLVLASGLLPLKGIINFTEKFRYTPNGEYLFGVTMAEDPGHVIVQIAKNQNDYTRVQVQNKTDGTGSSSGYIVNLGTRYGELLGVGANSTDATGRGADALVLESDNFLNGIVVLTQGTAPISFKTNGNNLAMQISGVDQGIVVGAATGGSQGAGTINVSGDIFKNGVAYTNPDYVFEQWAYGEIKRFATNPGAKDYRRMSLDEIEEHCRTTLRLPGIDDRPMGLFDRSDFALEKIEEIFTYLFELKGKLVGAAA